MPDVAVGTARTRVRPRVVPDSRTRRIESRRVEHGVTGRSVEREPATGVDGQWSTTGVGGQWSTTGVGGQWSTTGVGGQWSTTGVDEQESFGGAAEVQPRG
jgi:hypothetical protein